METFFVVFHVTHCLADLFENLVYQSNDVFIIVELTI